MTYATDGKIGVDLTGPTADKRFALGTRITASDGSVWVYVQANGSIGDKAWVGIDEDWQAAELTDAMALDGWGIGAAQFAFANDEYGFVPISGANLQGLIEAGCAADAALYTSAAAGVLDDATSVGSKISGVHAVAANTVSVAAAYEVFLSFPRVASL